jgi:hypothetical protein
MKATYIIAIILALLVGLTAAPHGPSVRIRIKRISAVRETLPENFISFATNRVDAENSGADDGDDLTPDFFELADVRMNFHPKSCVCGAYSLCARTTLPAYLVLRDFRI